MNEPPLSRWPAIEGVTISTDSWTLPFWEAARDHRLVVQECVQCGARRMPPTPFCPQCLSQDVIWPTLSGLGTIYSFTIVAKAVTAHQADCVPYVPAVIALYEAPHVRLVSNVVDSPLDALQIDAPVELVWHDRADGLAIPRFRLVA